RHKSADRAARHHLDQADTPGHINTPLLIPRSLCGSMPMMTRPTLVLLDQTRADVSEEGSATSSWADPS
ncbi:hypothetical protein, partial [Micromonospora sp. NPDC005113]